MIENAVGYDDDVVNEEVTATTEAPTEASSAEASSESSPDFLLEAPVDFV